MRFAIILLMGLFLMSCGGDPKPHQKLNGTWEHPLMTVTIDFTKGTYDGIGMGQQFSKKLTLVSEQGNAVVFKSDDDQITAQFQQDGSIILTKEGGIPIPMTRSK